MPHTCVCVCVFIKLHITTQSGPVILVIIYHSHCSSQGGINDILVTKTSDQTRQRGVCVCVCVFFPFILDIKFVGRTSRGHTGGRSHRISHPSSFCGACLNFSREKDSAIPFPRRPWSRILCTNDLIVLHPLGFFVLVFSFLVRKIAFAGIELTSRRVRGLRGTSELPGRPALEWNITV